MKSAVILHGMPAKESYLDDTKPSPSNRHWLPWVQRQLVMNGILAQTPEFPDPCQPVYEEWCKTFEQFSIGKETMLIGHSLGAGFILRWLSENKIEVGQVALVAPWLDPTKDLQNDFFNFEIDKDLLQRVKDLKVFVSTDDQQITLDSVKIIEENLSGVKVEWFKDKGHFTLGDMKTEVFPELKNFLLEK